MKRLLLPALAWLATGVFAASPLSPRQQGEDFDAMWRAVDANYAYFERGRDVWKKTRETWRPRAANAASRADFVAALEGALAELRDDHVFLSERSGASPRRIPFETDIWARWKDGAAVVEAVRTFGDADVAGLRPGVVITRVGGIPTLQAARERLGGAPPTASALDWALRRVLTGPRKGAQRLEIRDGRRTAALEIERTEGAHGNGAAILGRRMGEERDIGYLRVRVGANDERLADHFDGALNYLMDTRALILDLRENAGPGSREATQAILGRFVAETTPWQIREGRGQARTTDTVAPRGGVPYRAPVVVLVDRWTAGEGEALAAGLNAVARAQLVGTHTAGLRGELRTAKLPHSGVEVSFPGEKTFLVSDEPRDSLRPAVLVDLTAPSGGPGDPILYQALKLLERR